MDSTASNEVFYSTNTAERSRSSSGNGQSGYNNVHANQSTVSAAQPDSNATSFLSSLSSTSSASEEPAKKSSAASSLKTARSARSPAVIVQPKQKIAMVVVDESTDGYSEECKSASTARSANDNPTTGSTAKSPTRSQASVDIPHQPIALVKVDESTGEESLPSLTASPKRKVEDEKKSDKRWREPKKKSKVKAKSARRYSPLFVEHSDEATVISSLSSEQKDLFKQGAQSAIQPANPPPAASDQKNNSKPGSLATPISSVPSNTTDLASAISTYKSENLSRNEPPTPAPTPLNPMDVLTVNCKHIIADALPDQKIVEKPKLEPVKGDASYGLSFHAALEILRATLTPDQYFQLNHLYTRLALESAARLLALAQVRNERTQGSFDDIVKTSTDRSLVLLHQMQKNADDCDRIRQKAEAALIHDVLVMNLQRSRAAILRDLIEGRELQSKKRCMTPDSIQHMAQDVELHVDHEVRKTVRRALRQARTGQTRLVESGLELPEKRMGGKKSRSVSASIELPVHSPKQSKSSSMVQRRSDKSKSSKSAPKTDERKKRSDSTDLTSLSDRRNMLGVPSAKSGSRSTTVPVRRERRRGAAPSSRSSTVSRAPRRTPAEASARRHVLRGECSVPRALRLARLTVRGFLAHQLLASPQRLPCVGCELGARVHELCATEDGYHGKAATSKHILRVDRKGRQEKVSLTREKVRTLQD